MTNGLIGTLGLARHARRALAIAAATIIAPVAAHATVIATFDWVPVSENPTSAPTTTASGVLTLTLPSLTLGGPSTPPNLGQYYSSGTNATTAEITGLTYTDAEGLSINLSEVTTESLRSTTTPWVTSGLDTPAGATPGYYLVSGFNLSGTTSQGSPFMIANNIGTAGALFANGVGNDSNTFNATSSNVAITDNGYWQLETVTPVPLPPGLTLLLGGLGVMAWSMRRNGFARAL